MPNLRLDCENNKKVFTPCFLILKWNNCCTKESHDLPSSRLTWVSNMFTRVYWRNSGTLVLLGKLNLSDVEEYSLFTFQLRLYLYSTWSATSLCRRPSAILMLILIDCAFSLAGLLRHDPITHLTKHWSRCSSGDRDANRYVHFKSLWTTYFSTDLNFHG